MAKTSKISNLIFSHEWKDKFGGVNYAYNAELENGDKGEISTKSKDKYKIGDSLTYELNGERIKAVQNAYQKAYSKASDNKEYQVGVMVGASINCATTLLAHDIIKKEQFEETVKWLCNLSLKMKEHFKEI